jgi:PKHD-type hydroxylase
MFIQSMVRDAGQRRILYDMDMALLCLRSQYGETQPVVALTSTYQNLLRCWAEN